MVSNLGEKNSNLLDEVKKVQKNYKRKKSIAQKKKESNFSQKLKNLFDIAKLNVNKYIDEEKKLFLAGQRSKNRFGFIDNNTLTQQEDQNQDIMVVDSADVDEPADHMMLVTQKSAVLLSGLSATTSSQTSNVVSDFENQLSQQCQPKQN
ncbi:GSCOCG00012342001-RA-CDS [Cotesia congregata]|uniref:Uncharacterized protein n=1 Tax=Cotesia congregata TaxID=51543 RepID=A0A8J2HB90_COTCN|nr:GSCOCG00012342001-RA-CDS [Cotesia congregata]CAG5090657.1 Protein of unknown function [Cotesia congregata]